MILSVTKGIQQALWVVFISLSYLKGSSENFWDKSVYSDYQKIARGDFGPFKGGWDVKSKMKKNVLKGLKSHLTLFKVSQTFYALRE